MTFRGYESEQGGGGKHAASQAERRRVRRAVHEQACHDRPGHRAGVARHLEERDQDAALAGLCAEQVAEHRRRRDVKQPGPGAGHRERTQVRPQAG